MRRLQLVASACGAAPRRLRHRAESSEGSGTTNERRIDLARRMEHAGPDDIPGASMTATGCDRLRESQGRRGHDGQGRQLDGGTRHVHRERHVFRRRDRRKDALGEGVGRRAADGHGPVSSGAGRNQPGPLFAALKASSTKVDGSARRRSAVSGDALQSASEGAAGRGCEPPRRSRPWSTPGSTRKVWPGGFGFRPETTTSPARQSSSMTTGFRQTSRRHPQTRSSRTRNSTSS